MLEQNSEIGHNKQNSYKDIGLINNEELSITMKIHKEMVLNTYLKSKSVQHKYELFN